MLLIIDLLIAFCGMLKRTTFSTEVPPSCVRNPCFCWWHWSRMRPLEQVHIIPLFSLWSLYLVFCSEDTNHGDLNRFAMYIVFLCSLQSSWLVLGKDTIVYRGPRI